MSRYDISGNRDATIGWDPHLGTFFLQAGEWFGTTYAEWISPIRLVAYARRIGATPPRGMSWKALTHRLFEDQLDEPEYDPDRMTPSGPVRSFLQTEAKREAILALERSETLSGRLGLLRWRLICRFSERSNW